MNSSRTRRHAIRVLEIAVLLVAPLVPLLGQSYEQQLAQSQSALSAKQYKEAQAAADRAIKLDPNRWEGYVFAANAYSSQRLYDDAIGMLQLALPRAPEDKKMLIREALADARKQLSRPSPASTTSASQGATQAEIVLWKTIENSSNVSDFQAYLARYPNGTFFTLADARLKTLTSWIDSATGLTWGKQDNGSDIDWNKATAYCQNLDLAGYRDWRLPEIEELKAIYDPAANVDGSLDGRGHNWHVKGGIRLSGLPWSATQNPGKALYLDFGSPAPFGGGGKGYATSLGDSNNGRALCVRGSERK